LIRRLPKVRGFKNYDRKNKLTLTLTAIDKAYSKGEEVSLTTLLEKGLITNLIKKVRIINTGTLSNKLTFKEEEGLYLTKGVKGII
jgi:large subunit ribosomal protein L15